MQFSQLELIPEILKAIEKEGYTTPSPIQLKAIPLLLAGHDLLGSAQTGTGKTAAFAIPIIQKINEQAKYGPRLPLTALVLAPTRELAEQIKESFITYAKFLNIKTGAIYGGVSQRPQERMMDKGVDVLVATPGRLIDLVKQKIVNLSNVQTFVLDEADTMLDMGFIKDVKFINSLLVNKKQTLMFSATISLEIRNLSHDLLHSPRYLEMAPENLMLDTIKHSLIYAEKDAKRDALLDLLVDQSLTSVLVFTKTKHGANKLVTFLQSYGVKVDAIHGNKSQNKRQKALNDFKAKRIRVLIATDIAARGIDIHELSHVINYDVPLTPETYIHRIGRTGRAGLTGSAITLCSSAERFFIKQINKHTNLDLQEVKLAILDPEDRLQKDESVIAAPKPLYMEEKRKKRDNQAADKKGKSGSAKREHKTGDKHAKGSPAKRGYQDTNKQVTGKPAKREKAKKAKDPYLAEALKEDQRHAKKQRFSSDKNVSKPTQKSKTFKHKGKQKTRK